MCRLRLVMGAEKGPRGVCSGAFGVGSVAVGIVAGAAVGGAWRGDGQSMKKSRLAAGVGLWALCALAGPVVYDPVALGVGDAGELV